MLRISYRTKTSIYRTIALIISILSSIINISAQDRMIWTIQNTPTTGTLHGIAVPAGGGSSSYPAIAGENGLILLRSGSLGNWNIPKYITTYKLYSITDITQGSRIAITVGESGTILTSPDYATWAKKTSNTVYALRCVSHNWNASQDLIVAVGDNGTILTSSDGSSWKLQISGTRANLQSVTYSHSLDCFIAVGDSGTILSSKDGIRWARQQSPSKKCFRSICYSYRQNIIAGDSGVILTSIDTTDWTVKNSGTKNDLHAIYCLADLRCATAAGSNSPYFYQGNYFVAVGKLGTIVSSPDGIKWTVQSSGTQQNLNGISGVNNEFVVIGNRGTILTSKINYVQVLPFENRKDSHDLVIRGSSVLYYQSEARKTSLQIFNISGQLVNNICNQEHEKGLHVVTLPSNLSGGKYLISLKVGPEKYNRVVTLSYGIEGR